MHTTSLPSPGLRGETCGSTGSRTDPATRAPVISVAPMMGCTDRHCRYFFRQLAPGIRLYTEMITAQAVVFGNAERLLGFDRVEHPVALQLGGSDPRILGKATAIAADYGFDEVNLNLGCPSDRVQAGQFGACLMKNPALVADCVASMRDATSVPVTVKLRIGVDDQDSFGFLAGFVARVAAAGCRTFIVHARKALLSGLSPRENLQIPPLSYATVYRLKREFPDLEVHLNGGIASLGDMAEHLQFVDGLMIGRKAYQDPWFLTAVQARFLGAETGGDQQDRADLVRRMAAYARAQQESGVRLQRITRHLLGLCNGLPGARHWRRFLVEGAVRSGAGPELLTDSLAMLARPNCSQSCP